MRPALRAETGTGSSFCPVLFSLSGAPVKLNKTVRCLISSVHFPLIICPLPWPLNSLTEPAPDQPWLAFDTPHCKARHCAPSIILLMARLAAKLNGGRSYCFHASPTAGTSRASANTEGTKEMLKEAKGVTEMRVRKLRPNSQLRHQSAGVFEQPAKY